MGSCGVAVAAACQLPRSVLARAAEVAEREERAGQPATGAGHSPSRQPLAARNASALQGQPPPAKRPRLGLAAGASSDVRLAAEQQEALEAVRAAVLAALAGAPGAAAQLANLQAAVRKALAAGQL